MLFKKAPQNVVQQFSRVNRLQIEGGFAARLNPQHAIAEKSERTIAKGTETAGAVNVFRAEMPRQHQAEIFVGDFAVIWTKPFAMTLMLNLDPVPRRRRDVTAFRRARYKVAGHRLWQLLTTSAGLRVSN